MEGVINTLKELKEKTEKSFIENSIIVHTARPGEPVPDVGWDLERIIELRDAINILERSDVCRRSKRMEESAEHYSDIVRKLARDQEE